MKHILLVDDHAMARQALKLFLEQHGYACDEAEHEAAALGLLEQGRPVDLIVSDNHMTVMSGVDFLIQVKASAQFRSFPSFCIQETSPTIYNRRPIRHGVMAVLHKPYNFAEFVTLVNHALDGP